MIQLPADEITETLERFRKCKGDAEDYWKPIYKRSAQHRNFTLLGKQFDTWEARRYGLKRPVMPNLLLSYANHEANKSLQTDYVGKVVPNGYGATEQKALAREEVLRGIQRTENVSQVFNFARRDQIASGIAYSIARIEYGEKRGFGKKIRPKYLKDTYKVLPDPNVQNATFSDAGYWVVEEEIPIDKWKAETGIDPSFGSGQRKKKIWHFWIKKGDDDTEYLLSDGKTTKLDSEFPEVEEKDRFGAVTGKARDYAGVMLDNEEKPFSRPVTDFYWCWYKITEDFVIVDKEEWLGSHSPITACTGRKVVDENGDVYYQSMTEFAEVPQKMFTILYNIVALRLGRSPYSKWLIPFESVLQKQMEDLRRSSTIGDLDLLWKSLTDDGKPIPPPQEIEPHVIDPVIIQLMQQQVVEIQRIFGIFETDLRETGGDRSGVALKELKATWGVSNYDFLFNFLEYIEQVCRVILDLIPKYMTAPQQIAFVDRENKQTIQMINMEGGVSFDPDEEYSLAVEAVPTAETARREEAEFGAKMAEVSPLIANNPQALALIIKAQPGRMAEALAQIVAGNDPRLQEAQEMASRLQGELKRVTESAQAKIIQDAVQKQTLQGVITLLRQQMQLLRTANQAEKALGKAEADINPMLEAMEAQMKSLELQVDKQEADTNRIQAHNETVRIVQEAMNPKPPQNGKLQGAFPRPSPERMFPIRA